MCYIEDEDVKPGSAVGFFVKEGWKDGRKGDAKLEKKELEIYGYVVLERDIVGEGGSWRECSISFL